LHGTKSFSPAAPWKGLLEVLSSGLAFSPDAAIWSENLTSHASGLTGLFVFCVFAVTALLLLVVTTMIPLGKWVGHYLNSADDVVAAYSVNLLGSLAGIWFFAGMSALRLSPFYWFAFAFLLYLLVRNSAREFDPVTTLLMTACLVVVFHAAFLGRKSEWSPYQKLCYCLRQSSTFSLLCLPL
jgi:hypothetical protein